MEQPSLDAQIGNYVPIRFLAHWTLGERFLARAVNAGSQDPAVIVDRLWPELSRFEGFSDELDKIGRWKQVRHPAIAEVIEVGYHGSRPYVVSEFFEGRSLEALIQRRESTNEAIPPRVVLEIGIQLAQGLATIHEARDGKRPLGLIHGGLNPSRILLDSKARVKVLGGWSTRLEARLPWAVPPRTVVYQAPEEIWGRTVLDRRVDLYGLGVVLYETLAGRFCPSEDPIKFVRRVIRRDVSEAPGLETLPGPLQDLFRRLLAQEPAQRPGDARAVAEELRALLEGRAPERPAPPVQAKPAPPPEVETTTPTQPGRPKGPTTEELIAPDEPAEPDISLRVTTVIPPVMLQNTRQQLEVMHDPVDRSMPADMANVSPPPELSEESRPDLSQATARAGIQSLWFDGAHAAAEPPAPAASRSPAGPAQVEPAEQASVPRRDSVPPGTAPAAAAAAPAAPVTAAAAAAAPMMSPSSPPAAERSEHRPPVAAAPADSAVTKQPEPARPLEPEPASGPMLDDSATFSDDEEYEEETGPLELQEELQGPPRGFLVFREGSSNEYRYPLNGDVITLGRSSKNTYQILSEIKASRFHCEFQYDNGRWILVDKRSTNGTYVNGQPVDVHELKGRDKINIGFTTFRFLMADAAGNAINAAPERVEKPADATAQRGKRQKRHLRAALVRNMGTPQESRHEITGDVFLIGARASGNSLQLEDPLVAPSHCEIRYQDGCYVIEDHQSEHGTLVNGFLVDTLSLDGGEEITVGGETMRFVLF